MLWVVKRSLKDFRFFSDSKFQVGKNGKMKIIQVYHFLSKKFLVVITKQVTNGASS